MASTLPQAREMVVRSDMQIGLMGPKVEANPDGSNAEVALVDLVPARMWSQMHRLW